MRFKGRVSRSWHDSIDAIAGCRWVTDVDFPWTALHDHTRSYLRKKKKKKNLTQEEIDERLGLLVETHSSKAIAIGACAQALSATAIRNLALKHLGTQTRNAPKWRALLELIISMNRCNRGGLEPIEVERAQYLSDCIDGKSTQTLSQQLHQGLLLLQSEHQALLLQSETQQFVHDLSGDLICMLDDLWVKHLWDTAAAATEWLRDDTDADSMVSSLEAETSDLWTVSWRAWKRWKPDLSRCALWTDLAARIPIKLSFVLFLAGPDFVSRHGSERATYRDFLLDELETLSQPSITFGGFTISYSENPSEGHQNPHDILERVMKIFDFASLRGPEFLELVDCSLRDGVINHDTLQVLEGVKHFDTPILTRRILKVYNPPQHSDSRTMPNLKQLLTLSNAFVDPGLAVFFRQLMPRITAQIISHWKKLRQNLSRRILFGEDWAEEAHRVVACARYLRENQNLRSRFDGFITKEVLDVPSIDVIDALHGLRHIEAKDCPSRLRVHVDQYCDSLFSLHQGESQVSRPVFETFFSVWQRIREQKQREVAMIVLEYPTVTDDVKRECLRDLDGPFQPFIDTFLQMSRTSQSSDQTHFHEFVDLLASETRSSQEDHWRQILHAYIQSQDEHLQRSLVNQKPPQIHWNTTIDTLRTLFRDSKPNQAGDGPKILSEQVRESSHQLSAHTYSLLCLEKVRKTQEVLSAILLGSDKVYRSEVFRMLQLICDIAPLGRQYLVDSILGTLSSTNVNMIINALLKVSVATFGGIQRIEAVLKTCLSKTPLMAEYALAVELQKGDLSSEDSLTLRVVLGLHGIKAEPTPELSRTVQQRVIESFATRRREIMIEARRLETLRLTLRAVAFGESTAVLTKMKIEIPSPADDAIALLPFSLAAHVEKVSDEVVELRFPTTTLTKMQRFAANISESDSFVVRLGLEQDLVPTEYCVHLGSSLMVGIREHSPIDTRSRDKDTSGTQCFVQPNRACMQLSGILLSYLGSSRASLESSYNYIADRLSDFGAGCIVCGAGRMHARRLRRTTVCLNKTCMDVFENSSLHIRLADVWQDPTVVDLLVLAAATAVSVAGQSLGGFTDCLSRLTPSEFFKDLNDLPVLPTIKELLQQGVINERDTKFERVTKPGTPSTWQRNATYYYKDGLKHRLIVGLTRILNSYRGFLVTATGSQRIPSFGSRQFLLANASPELEMAFSQHMNNNHPPKSQIVFHGTSLDRLYPILKQGLRVQSGTPKQRHGAVYGPGVYTSTEPRTAWVYAKPTPEENLWKNSSMKDTTRVLLACELAGELPVTSGSNIFVITDPTRLAVRYIFLPADNATMPWAKDVSVPLTSVFRTMTNGTL